MTYRTFTILIADGEFSKWVDVVACDVQAAHADIFQAYGEQVHIIQTQYR